MNLCGGLAFHARRSTGDSDRQQKPYRCQSGAACRPLTFLPVMEQQSSAVCDPRLAHEFFYAAVPAGSVVGSLIAGWLLQMHWKGMAGWRWIFIVEGILPIVLGIITIFYLTDWPRQAGWLPEDARNWITGELEAETQAKKNIHDYTVWESFRNGRVWLLILAYFFALGPT